MSSAQPVSSPRARIAVAAIYVEALQVWFVCPHCQIALEGYLGDPRGQPDVVCEACGGTFDLPRTAAVVIT